MLKTFSVAILGAGFMALAILPAQALDLGPVQVIVQPRVVLVPDSPPPRRVVVVEREEHHYHHRPVVEKRVIIHKHHHKRDRHREVVIVRERDRDHDDRWRHPYGGMEREDREVVVIRR